MPERAPRKFVAGRVLFVAFFPLLVLGAFALAVERQHFADLRTCIYGGVAAYVPLLWGSVRFMFAKAGTVASVLWRIALPWGLAAACLGYGSLAARGSVANRTPDGWSKKVPRYPGALLSADKCSEYECAATYAATRSEIEGKKRIERYDTAHITARLPAQGWPATCPSLGRKCRIYAVADVRLLECLDAAENTVLVRYGSQPCPDGESEADASPTY